MDGDHLSCYLVNGSIAALHDPAGSIVRVAAPIERGSSTGCHSAGIEIGMEVPWHIAQHTRQFWPGKITDPEPTHRPSPP